MSLSSQLCRSLKSGELQFQTNWAKTFARPHLNGEELGVEVHACHPSYDKKLVIGGSRSGLAWAKSETLAPKQSEQKGLGVWLKR
jgi:hypothetical protein